MRDVTTNQLSVGGFAMPQQASIPSSNSGRRLQYEQCRVLYEYAYTTLTGALSAVLFVLVMLWGRVDNVVLFIWAAVTTALYLLRYALVYRYHAVQDLSQAAHKWAHAYIWSIFVTGLAWGSFGVLFAAESMQHMIFLILAVVGLSAASTVAYASVRWASTAFIIPSMLPLGLRILIQGDPGYLSMGVPLLIFMVALLVAAQRMYIETTERLRLSIENEDLARFFENEKNITDQLNQKLQTEIAEHYEAVKHIEASERELSRILENMQDTYYRTDAEGCVVHISSSTLDLLGYTSDEVLGHKLSDFYVEPDGRDKFLARLQAENGVVKHYVAPLRRRDGSIVWVSSNAQYYRDQNGDICGIEGIARDISALKQAELELSEERERAQVTLQSIGDGVITTTVDGRVEYLNAAAEQLTGWSMEQSAGQWLYQVFDIVQEESRERVPDILKQCLQEQKILKVPGQPILMTRKGTHEYSVEISVSPLCKANGRCSGAVLIFHDVTELRGLAREMSYQATHDTLTGLCNRSEFEHRLSLALTNVADGDDRQHALMYLDLDQFKIVNDTCGHVAGDELLRQLTGQLQARVRGSDLLARLGGDEFGVLLENCSLEEAEAVANTLRQITHQFHFQWQDKVFEIGVSIGLVSITTDSGDLSSVLSAADSACYVAKELGRNRVHVFRSDDAEVARHHGQMQWIQRIKECLAEDRFVLYCQHVVAVDTNNGYGNYNEFLMRLVDENDQIVPPMTFIPAAERYRLMPEIDRWVVRNALQNLNHKVNWDKKEVYAINLSGQSLTDEGFLDFVVEQLNESGVPPEFICFEITETAAIANLMSATRFINVLKGMGCLFALDDFGSGLSSFTYLKKLPVNYLKIDGHFIREITEDPAIRAMVEAINRIGHIFGMQTIAEFVENESILASLQEMGVDYAQGYEIGHPEPLDIALNQTTLKKA